MRRVSLALVASGAALAMACARRAPETVAMTPGPSSVEVGSITARVPTGEVIIPVGSRPGDSALATSPLLAAIDSREAHRVADSIVALMTLDEKLGQLTMTPAAWLQTGPAVPAGGEDAVRKGQVGSFLSFWGAQRTRDIQRVAVEQSRLKIPLLFGYDVIHGWRTVFPIGLGEAATFDSAAVAQAARISAVEASAFGINWTFSPMVDISREPRWGRMAEGSGEDVYLGSVMAAAHVVGFQGTGPVDNTTVLATIKHYAAYGAPEGGRDYDVVDLSERSLWETYLPPYEAGVRAGAATIMSSFNEIGGTPAHASAWLLKDVLRDRWGFKGLVVSDWTGIMELMNHGIAPTKLEAARRAMLAGVEIEMSSTFYRDTLAVAVRDGRVPMAVVDSAVSRTLRLKYALGLFQDPYRYSDTTREKSAALTPANRAAARQAAQKAIVLLQNDSVAGGGRALPLSDGLRTVAVIGPLADDRNAALGPWLGGGRQEDAVTVLAGLRAAMPSTRFLVAKGVPMDTMRAPVTLPTSITDSINAAVAIARRADAIILVLGEHPEQSGEAASRSYVELPGAQTQLVRAVAQAARAARKPVVVVLTSGRALALGDIAPEVPAIVETWFLGVEAGNAVADVLLGRANPSGRLPVTFPRTTGQVPIHYDRKNTGRPPATDVEYSSKYLDLPFTPLYPFGHGLSYTTFGYANVRVASASVTNGSPVTVEATVSNTGSRAGEEVVQLYLRDDAGSVTRPTRMLRGFQRVMLQPGESRTVRFTLQPDALALYDANMRKVVEPGTFTVWVGGSSIVADRPGTRFEVTGDTLVLAPAPTRMR